MRGEAPVFAADGKLDTVLKSRPLAFLLQVNCDEVSALWPGCPLPKHGLLSFFYEMDSMLWGPERLDKIGYVRVHYFENTEGFVRTPFPHDLHEGYRIIQHPIMLHRQANLPPLGEFERYTGMTFTRCHANRKQYDEYRTKMGVGHSHNGEIAMGSRLFGWPESIQNDVFDEFLNEYWKDGPLDPHPVNTPAGTFAAEDEWELLLQLSSSTYDEMKAVPIMFGDYSNLYFSIRKDDLAKGDFGKVWFTLQCT